MLADKVYLRELAAQHDKDDGQPLTDVLRRLEDETRALIMGDPYCRELSLVLTNLQVARMWATERIHVIHTRAGVKEPAA